MWPNAGSGTAQAYGAGEGYSLVSFFGKMHYSYADRYLLSLTLRCVYETVRTLIGKCKPLFVAQLAAYARETMNLRSIPLVMAVELARIHQGDNLVKRVTARTVRRADEITELLACYQQANRRTGTK